MGQLLYLGGRRTDVWIGGGREDAGVEDVEMTGGTAWLVVILTSARVQTGHTGRRAENNIGTRV